MVWCSMRERCSMREKYISISEVYTLTYFSITLIMYINLMLAVIRHVNSEKCRTI